ncbi:hypothetical protein WJR50_03590 [Catalinimonas sp. 4WD22]|uniref:hypothetical protein n=1 Tax=Catalinimonas locisalis TaxID=3133978 RepID=UPI003100F514
MSNLEVARQNPVRKTQSGRPSWEDPVSVILGVNYTKPAFRSTHLPKKRGIFYTLVTKDFECG